MSFERDQFARHFATVIDVIATSDEHAIRTFLRSEDPMSSFCEERLGESADTFTTPHHFEMRKDGLWCWEMDDDTLFFAFKAEVPECVVVEFKMLFG